MTTTRDLMQDVLAEDMNMAKRLDQLVRAGLMAPQALPTLHRGLSKLNAGMAITGQDRDAVTNLLNSLLFIVLGDDTMFQKSQTTVRQNKQEHGHNVATHMAMEAKKDPGEYDYEGDMAMSQLKSIMMNAKRLHDCLEPETNLPEWVQSKITLAEDYITTATNYVEGTLDEEVEQIDESSDYSLKHTGTIHHKDVTDDYDQPVNATHKSYDILNKKDQKVGELEHHHDDVNGHFYGGNLHGRNFPFSRNNTFDSGRKNDAHSYLDSALKSKWHTSKYGTTNEEVEEIDEGRPSQRHPLEGHPYHKKSNAELEYIAKDAHKAAEAMKSHNTTAENKYRDQANDSATVRHFRKTNGMPTWYKKKYGHSTNEEVEQVDELDRSGTLTRYINKTRNNPERKAGNALALKKKWGNKNYGLGEPKVKGMDRNEEVELVDEKASDKEVKMATGIPHDKRYVGGNMTGAISAIEKIRRGLSKHPRVAASLKSANEATKLYKDLAYPSDGGVELPIENELQEDYAEKFQTALKASGKTLAEMSDDEKKTFFKHLDSIHTTNSGE